MTRCGDLITIALSGWLIAGLFIDGWAHNTRPLLETFFTPWHAVFYSGFAAITGWIGWLVTSRRAPGRSWTQALPRGYVAAAAGVLAFGACGLGDMAWHEIFGIEQGISALLSPTHLGLFAGAFLIVTAPLRSLWADPALGRPVAFGRLLPAVMSLALAGALCAFILMQLNIFKESFYSVGLQQFIAEAFPGDGFVPDRNIQAGLASFIVTTVVLFGPLLFLLHRWDPPPGAMLTVIGTQAVAMAGLEGFEDPAMVLVGLLAASVVEAAARRLRPSPTRLLALRAFCVLAPAGFWAVYLAAAATADGGLGWPAEIWGGSIAWSALTLLGLSLVMYPPTLPPGGAEQPNQHDWTSASAGARGRGS